MKAWLYYRLSRDEDAEMNSLQNQRQILADYAEQNGYDIIGESFDDNVSGMTFNRKGIGQLETAVDEGKIDIVLVKDLSRLGRHRTQTALFIDHLRENNVKVYSVTEGIDSTNENDDMLIGFKQLFNDFYAKDISKKVRAGVRQKQKSTGIVETLPMGYAKDKNTGMIMIDEDTAWIVREVFRLYIEGYGLTTIAKKMNAEGIKSPDYYFNRKYKTITAVPEDEQYRHDNFCEPIIDETTWKQAQFMLEQRSKINPRSQCGRNIHRYAGMIKCAECGANLIARRRKWKDKEYVEYTCNSNHRYGKEYCTPHSVREEQLDSLVNIEIVSLLEFIQNESAKYEKIVRNWLKKKPKYDKEIQRNNEKIKQCRDEIEQLIIERINDREHAKIYNNMIEKREAEIRSLEQKIAELRNYDEVCKKRRVEMKNTSELIETILADGHISNVNLRMLVRQVTVHQNEDKSIDISFDMNGAFDYNIMEDVTDEIL